MSDRFGQYLIAGVGGQGVVTAASVLSRGATNAGLRVLGSETHGMSQRGGSVVSHWKVGDFTAPLVRKGAADCLLAFNHVEGYRNLDFIRPGGKALFNAPEGVLLPEIEAFFDQAAVETVVVDGLALVATKRRYKSLNQLMLGCAAELGWLPFGTDDLAEVVRGFGKPQFREANVWAFEQGVELAREVS
jgi:indolepyruvate ferredoxin oxidoreductase, beta subunit